MPQVLLLLLPMLFVRRYRYLRFRVGQCVQNSAIIDINALGIAFVFVLVQRFRTRVVGLNFVRAHGELRPLFYACQLPQNADIFVFDFI